MTGSDECIPPGSGAWRVRFHWYLFATIPLGVAGACVTGTGVPVGVGVGAAIAGVAMVWIGTWAARRVELCVTADGVRCCNGFVVMTYAPPELSGVRLGRENIAMSASSGIQLLTRGPTGAAPREYRLGSVPFVSVGLPLHERERLVAALARLLGDDAVASLIPWTRTREW